MPSNDRLSYREWRERGETAVGAFFRMVPYQYIWLVLALMAILVWLGAVSIKDLQF